MFFGQREVELVGSDQLDPPVSKELHLRHLNLPRPCCKSLECNKTIEAIVEEFSLVDDASINCVGQRFSVDVGIGCEVSEEISLSVTVCC